jgi:hypothetical protein
MEYMMTKSNSCEELRKILPEGGPTSVLVLTPARSLNASQIIQNLFTTDTEVNEPVLVVSYVGYDSTWLQNWQDDLGHQLSNLKVIEVLDEPNQTSNNTRFDGNEIWIDDLDTLESNIMEFFDQSLEINAQPILFFDSLSALANYAGAPAVHDLLARILTESERVGARSYFHVARSHRGLAQDLSPNVDITAELPVDDQDGWLIS